MKQEKKWLRRLMPLMVLISLCFAQSSFAQDDYGDNTDGSSYNNNDEALIQPEKDLNYNTFHDELSPYGNWMNYPGYGNVWVANIPGFRPYYTGGHWAYTRYGWTWASDFNWGWAPFHYGRWAFDASYGWFWVPGYTWGPAWVSWRNGGDYYGWAPLSPGLNVGINIGIGIPANDWVFLPHRYMGYRSLNPYYVDRGRNVTIIRNTTIINNTSVYGQHRYFEGPRKNQVERYSGRRIQEQEFTVANRRNEMIQNRSNSRAYNPRDNRNANVENSNRQDNVRQQNVDRQSMQNRGLQPLGDVNNGVRTRPMRNGQRNDNNTGDNTLQDQLLQQQRGQQQDNQRNQQVEQQRQQMNERRQQMEQRRQQDVQHQQQDIQRQLRQTDQQRQQQMQQRQQQIEQRQQRQQVFPQRQENIRSNQPAQGHRGGNAGGQRGRRNG